MSKYTTIDRDWGAGWASWVWREGKFGAEECQVKTPHGIVITERRPDGANTSGWADFIYRGRQHRRRWVPCPTRRGVVRLAMAFVREIVAAEETGG